MAIKWIKTNHTGLRYYEHTERKHGKKRDRYYAIRFKVDDREHSYGIGWLSDGVPVEIEKENQGIGFEEYCLMLLRQYRGNLKTGSGPQSPKEKRKIAEETKKQREKANMTFGQFFETIYFPIALTSKKASTTYHEKFHFRLWIDPVIGKKPFKDVSSFDIERIKKNLLGANRTPRTCQYVFATIRQVWNMARRSGEVSGDSPTQNVKIPKIDNRRQRFLSHQEAEQLLQTLKEKDKTLYRMALLSLHTGLRASEVFNLTWGCVDTERGIIRVLDAKSGHGRAAFMTDTIQAMFDETHRGNSDDRVFMQRKGIPYTEIPTLFRDIVKNLKFNENVSDARQRVCFHSFRHSFASWHAEAGTDLYVIKELLGHGSITLTERYSHLSPGTLQNATRTLEQSIKAAKKTEGQVLPFTK